MSQLTASVGSGGRNLPTDTSLVQRKLQSQGVDPGPIDGVCGAQTIAAIRQFQQRRLGFADGLVEPGLATWRALDGATPARTEAKPQTDGPPRRTGQQGATERAMEMMSSLYASWSRSLSAHPGSPAGAGGTGRFKMPTMLDFFPAVRGTLSHPQAPSARPATAQDTRRTVPAKTAANPGKSTPVSPSANPAALTDEDYKKAAARLAPEIDYRLLKAFAKVESGGRSGFGGSGLPVIAYEGHIFRKLTGKVHDKAYPMLSYKYVKKAGPEWQVNNKNQTKAWETLNSAIALNREAALKSTSWGKFQVVGLYSGYPDVEDFVSDMKTELGQLEAFVKYCKARTSLISAMKAKNYQTMASIYNGDDYGNYDKLIEKAYKAYCAE